MLALPARSRRLLSVLTLSLASAAPAWAQQCPPDPFEPNDDCATAVTLPLGLHTGLAFGFVELGGTQVSLAWSASATALCVSLHNEGASLPIPDSWSDDPNPVAGDGYTRGSMPQGAGRLFQVSEPGTHEIDPPVLDGFAPLPRQRVELIAGQRTVLALEYERVR